jgi:hypothetical protein
MSWLWSGREEWRRHFTGIHPRPVEPAGRGSGVDLTGPIPVSATDERDRADTPSPLLMIPVTNVPSYVHRLSGIA